MSHRGNISSPAATMSSIQTLREFIDERLTTAAGEIFTVFEQTIVQYEEEIVRQEKLLQIARKPQIKIHRTESPKQHIDHQKTSSSLEQEEHEAPHIKEEEDIVEVTVTDGESENSLGYVRDLTTQRLTAAAGEIFTVLERTIVQYEEEIDRQRRLLEIIWKPQIKLHRAELPEHHDCTEEQLFKQEINYFLKQEESEEPEPPQIKEEQEEPEPPQIKEEQEEPEPPQIKEEQEEPEPSHIEEHEELGTSQEGEQLVLKVESDSFRVPSIEEQSQCGAIVRKKRKLCQNVGTVTDKKKKLCEICGERYSRRSDLLIHLSTHTGEKPYTCETCDKSFNRPSNLFVHMRTHTGEKPYSCGTCGKSFSVHSTLYRHMRTHTGEKPYPCETCGKSFSQHSNLLLHMRTHTGEKPYSCEICEKSFCRQDNFLRHMKAHKEMKS